MKSKGKIVLACGITFVLTIVATVAFMLIFNVGIGDKVFVSTSDYDKVKRIADKYSEVETIYQFLEENYYTELDEHDLMTGILKGLMEGTGDPYTKYMTKEEYQMLVDTYSAEFTGIGVTMSVSDDGQFIEVISVMEDSPAEKAGIKDGDYIVAVDDVEYSGEKMNEAAQQMRGDKGTKVKITISRKNKLKDFTITRDEISTTTVYSEIRDDNIGYIRITSFGNETAEQFKTELEKLESNKNVKGFVLDLRSNGGGLVNESIEIADMLMDEGTVVYLEDGNDKKTYYKSEDGRTNLKYVVLVNGGTASSSEILTTGIQGNGEGTVVGTKTYGKGITQNTWEMKDGSGLEITTSQYFGPKGNVIHKKGITPDVVVDFEESDIKDDTIVNDRQLNTAISTLKSQLK